jgi:hypothetical protein
MRSFASLLLGGIVLDGSCRIRSGARSLHERGASSLRVCRNIASSTARDAGTSVRWGHGGRMSRKTWWSRKPMCSLLQFRRRNFGDSLSDSRVCKSSCFQNVEEFEHLLQKKHGLDIDASLPKAVSHTYGTHEVFLFSPGVLTER